MYKKDAGRAAFNEAYASLNAAQKEAVDTIDGPVMVVAGPGTGKTQILTLRIANILIRTDTPADGVLALTFTESGAKAMRERLRRYIGAEAYRVPIFTFHGFAQRLIGEYPDAFPRIIGGRPAGDLEKITIIEDILNGGDITLLRPLGNPSYYVTPILRSICTLKQEYVTPDRFATLIAEQEQQLAGIEQYHTKGAHKGKVRGEYTNLEKQINKNRELLYVYRQYEALLGEAQLFDFDDMLLGAVTALAEQEDMLRDVQERYLYVLADEHQDVNGTQNKLLELITSYHERPNIFAVGDEKQAIYRFQGASLENFLFFTEQFPDTSVISLTENYRSGQTILDAAHDLVAVEDGPLAKLRLPLHAAAVSKAAVTFRSFSHQAIEDDWLISAVQDELASGTPAEEVAVIVRTNREVESMAAKLRKAGFSVAASADGDVLQHPITQAVQALLDLVVIETSEVALFTTLHGAYWGISSDDVLRVLSGRKRNRSLQSIIADPEILAELNVKEPAAIQRVHEVITTARDKEVHEAPHRVLEYILEASGFRDHIIAHDPYEGARVLRRLYDEIEALVVRENIGSVAAVGGQLRLRQSYNLPLTAPYIAAADASVQVLTAHKSKGLEFNCVFVPHLSDAAWSGAGKRQYFNLPITKIEGEHDAIEDERRLLYVAMTRARQRLQLSVSEQNSDGKELLPARLLEDIDESLIASLETDDVEAAFNPLSGTHTDTLTSPVDPELIRSLVAERGFSATSLNNYLRSPWDYFFRNILRIPEVQSAHLQYGTAIHNTLEFTTREHTKRGTLPAVSAMEQQLTRELERMPLSTEEFTRLHAKGLEELAVYREHLAATLPAATREELSVSVQLETGIPELPVVPLTGKLDRLDLNEAGEAVRVVDYKTGKPKTRNAIEGKTKTDDGGYKRQLVFYALLLDLYDDDRYRCKTGTLSFVQADKNGTVKEESFTITDEEISALKAEIVEAVRVIVAGSMLQSTCDPQVSEYCHLATRWQVKGE